jgi:predicted ester cyclase
MWQSFIHHDPDFPNFHTREDYKQWVTEARNAFPDLHLTIDDMIAEGDKVVTRWTFRGTNTGDMVSPMHIPATGKQVTVTGITIDRFANSKFVEDWHQGDIMGFMQQLGLVPAMG